MPKIKTSRAKQPPEGFAEIEETLQEFAKKMKDGKFCLLAIFLPFSTHTLTLISSRPGLLQPRTTPTRASAASNLYGPSFAFTTSGHATSMTCTIGARPSIDRCTTTVSRTGTPTPISLQNGKRYYHRFFGCRMPALTLILSQFPRDLGLNTLPSLTIYLCHFTVPLTLARFRETLLPSLHPAQGH